MTTWLEELLSATSELETPRKFFLWTGLSVISAIVKNNVWVDRYGGTEILRVYPNLYVMLIAPSGHGKGVPVAIAKAIVNEVGNVKVISGRNSIESILQELGHAKTAPGRKGPSVDSTAFIVSGELSTSLVRNPDSLTILTDLHDGQYNKDWKNTMKHTGVDRLERVNLTMLGGLNETHFNDMISEKEITGGFIARCQLVFSRERDKKNSLLRPPKKTISIGDLAAPLRPLKELAGPMKLTEEAIEVYDEWYHKYSPEKTSDKTGAAMRVRDHVLKVAQLMALSREPRLVIEAVDIKDALKICLESVAKVETVTKGAGQSEMMAKQKAFLEVLLKKKKATREEVLQRCHGDFDAHDLNRLVETFQAAGIIKEAYNGFVDGKRDKKDIIYELSERTIEEYFADEKGEETKH